MNVVFTMSLPRSIKVKQRTSLIPQNASDDDETTVIPFQNVYASVEINSLKELLRILHENDFIVAREFNAKTKLDGTRLYEDRGEIIINCQFIGKIKPFFE
jgi:hypothetical protein